MTGNSVAEIAVSNIQPSPFQHRRMFDDGALRELAKSIQQDGLIQPITVRPVNAHFELIAGERRWRAFQLAGLADIPARILEVDDLQARRLCATENLQRADLTPLEEVMALTELVDASLLEFSADYAPLATIQEPKWRVKALLTAFESKRKIELRGDTISDEMKALCSKFTAQVDAVFSGLPKPKDPISFTTNDLPLLFTANEVQQFALEHRLNKAQTKAIDALQKAAPDVFKAIAQSTPQQAIQKISDLASDPVRPVADKEVGDIESVNDFSAETIRQAAKNHRAMRRQQAAIFVERSFDSPQSESPDQPVAIPVNPVAVGDWWQLGRHQLYCGDTSKPEFYAELPHVDFAFADPPYGVQADEWDGAFYWEHDWLIEKAPIVAVTPGQPAIVEFSRKTAMPYRNSMASWITNGMTLSEFGFQNWIYLAVFARDGISIFRQCQDVIRCTIDLSTTLESNHRGRKPAELLTKLIELYCPEDGAVIDPFLGSGTTLLVADTMNRVCYGGELNPDYCWRIIQRWEYQTGNKAVKR